MKALRQRLTQLAACTISLSLIATSSPAYDPSPALSESLQRLTPSHGLGVISDHYKGSDPRTVVLVQDLHVNYSVQKSIVGLLAQYADKHLLPPFIGVEGAAGPIDASVLSSLPDAAVRHDAADYFMKKGELSGPAAFAIEQGQAHLLYGIEQGAYYDMNKGLFQKSLAARKTLAHSLAEFQAPLMALKHKTYTYAMRAADRHCAKYVTGEISRDDYDATFERLRALAVTPMQKNLVEADHYVQILSRLLLQHAIEEDVKDAATHLSEILPLLGSMLSLDGKSLSSVADAVKASLEFYVVAAMRERPMFENTLARMDATKTSLGILVAGGFHTRGLTALLKAHGISYVVITPNVKKLDAADDRLYEARLMGLHVSEDEALSDAARTAFATGDTLSPGFDILQRATLWGPIRAYVAARMYRESERRHADRSPEQHVQSVARALAIRFGVPADSIAAPLQRYAYGIEQAPEQEAQFFASQKLRDDYQFLLAHGKNPLALVGRGVGYLIIVSYATAMAWIMHPLLVSLLRPANERAQLSRGDLFVEYQIEGHAWWNRYVGALSWFRLSLPEGTVAVPANDLNVSIAFGTSGWRGLLVPAGSTFATGAPLPKGSDGFTLENVSRTAQAIADVVQNDENYQSGLPVGVGYDARPGGREFAIRVVEVLRANGIRVKFVDDVMATPVMAEMTRPDLPANRRFAIGIHLTASHNPVYYSFEDIKDPAGNVLKGAMWMGIKVMRNGTPADDAYTGAIAARANDKSKNGHYAHAALSEEDLAALRFDAIQLSNERLAKAFQFDDPVNGLIARLNALQDQEKIKKILFNVLHGGTSPQVQRLVEMLIEKGLKVPVDVLNTRTMNQGSVEQFEDGHPLKVRSDKDEEEPWGPEPRPIMYKAKMQDQMKPGVMAGIFDGDGDRAEIYDVDGKTTQSPNKLGVLFAHFLLKSGRVKGDANSLSLVRTLPTTRNLDLLAKFFGLPLHQTPVGSKHFNQYMDTLVTGTEESGHLFFRLNGQVFADSAIGEFLLGLLIVAETGKSLEEYYEQDVVADLRTVGTPLVYNRTAVESKYVNDRLKDALKTLRADYPQEFADALSASLGKTAAKVDSTTDKSGILVEFTDGSWAMYRLSGTDGSVRIYGEDSGVEKLTAQEKKVQEVLLSLVDVVEEKNVEREKLEARLLGEKLTTPLRSTGDPAKDEQFRKGGYKQPGYGVTAGAAVNGNFAFEGNQGYFAEGGKEAFLKVFQDMRDFFARRAKKGRAVRYIIKVGIGGQHTPFQGIANGFEVIDAATGKVAGEYELGKDFETSIQSALDNLGATWKEVAVIPSSKSGSTDETMIIFAHILAISLKQAAIARGALPKDAQILADAVLNYLHDLNIDENGVEKKDLFRGFSFDEIERRLAGRGDRGVHAEFIRGVFADTLGRMFFETTDNPNESRLSAFIRNSGLDKLLGDDAPGFGAMFENVGGRWTADLHMLTFLAYHNLDAGAYWESRHEQIEAARYGGHLGNHIGDLILDDHITDIALVVPDDLFWFGKSNEQNFNESIWQNGFANLVAIPESLWKYQSHHYANHPNRLVINMTNKPLGDGVIDAVIRTPDIQHQSPQALAMTYARLFSTFYAMTTTVGNRLIVRALRQAGTSVEAVDLNNLENKATQIVQANLYVRQPYVELGKGLVDKRFQALQAAERATPGAITAAMRESQRLASEGQIKSNISDPQFQLPENVKDMKALAGVIKEAADYAEKTGRKFVPFLYVEGQKFQELRIELTKLGVEWVLQGTGDQHISYQQVLAQPQKFLPLIISFVPEAGKEIPGVRAIGFSKPHLDNISPHLLRDYFAEGSYEALTKIRAAEDPRAQGIFIRLQDTEAQRKNVKAAFKQAYAKPASARHRSFSHTLKRIQAALGQALPKGTFVFWPDHDFMAGEPLSVIQPTKTAAEARERLGDGNVVYEAYLRGVDGAGSSNDLPGLFREQRNENAKGLGRFSSTPTFASNFKIRVKFEKADDPQAIDYVAPQYNTHTTFVEPAVVNEKGYISQKDAPNYILRLFGLSGIRLTMLDVDERAQAGGMGTSGAFNLALLEFANQYSGAGLSQADLIALSVYLENDVFGGLTGGQEAISSMMGGGYLHIWLRGFHDDEGQFPNGFVSIPLPEERLQEFSNHAVLLQAGKSYNNGVAEINRYAKLTNIGWTDGIEDRDPYIVQRHLDNVRLTFEYIDALQKGDWGRVARTLDAYVKNRDENSIRWMQVVLDWHEGNRDGLPAYAEKWANRVFKEEGNKDYKDFGAIRDLYAKHGGALRTMSLYTLDPLATEIAEARRLGLALFPLGAGGPTTIALLFDPQGLGHLQKAFLQPRGFHELTRAMAREAATAAGRHEQRGYIPYSVGMEPDRLISSEAEAAAAMPMRWTQKAAEKIMNRRVVQALIDKFHLNAAWVRAILETGIAEIAPWEDAGIFFYREQNYGAQHRDSKLAIAGLRITRVATLGAATLMAVFSAFHGGDFAGIVKIVLIAIVLTEKAAHLAINVAKLIADFQRQRATAQAAETARESRLTQSILQLGEQLRGWPRTMSTFLATFMVSLHVGTAHQDFQASVARFGASAFITAA